MNRISRKKVYLTILLVPILFIFSNLKVNAETASLSMSVSSQNVNVGDTVTVSIKGSAGGRDTLSTVTLNYNSSVLKYVSDTELVTNEGSDKLTYSTSNVSITFEAIGPGNANLSASGSDGVELANPDATYEVLSGASASVTVAAPRQYSADNSLKSLSISPGTLSPSFSQSNTNYTATVPSGTTKLVVTATPSHNAAKVTSVSGADSLSVGRNDVKVVVQAEDGSTATYTIAVTRESGPAVPTVTPTPSLTPTPSPTPVPELPPIEVDIGGKKLLINSGFEESSMPEAFSKDTMEYDNQEISIATSNNGDLILFYLTDANDENGEFYIYDEETDTFTEYIEIEGRGGRHIILPQKEEIEVPENFLETTFSVGGTEVSGWQLDGFENGDFYLVYAMDGQGNKGIYSFDSVDRTFQRFSSEYLKALKGGEESEELLELQASIGTLQDDLNKSNENLSNLRGEYDTDMQNRLYIIIGLSVASVIFIILLVNLLLKNKFLKEDLAENQTIDYDSDLSDLDDTVAEFATTEEVAPEYKFEEVSPDIGGEVASPDISGEEVNPDIRDQEDIVVSDSSQEKDAEDDIDKNQTSDLENASLEDIFEYLNIDDTDIDDDLK